MGLKSTAAARLKSSGEEAREKRPPGMMFRYEFVDGGEFMRRVFETQLRPFLRDAMKNTDAFLKRKCFSYHNVGQVL